MALFKPKQGYMSKPIQEQPMAAPKPAMGMMQTQQPRRSLMSVPDAGQAMADAPNAQAAQPAQGAQGAPAQAGKKYSLVINQFDTPQEAAAKAAAVPPEVRATIPQTVSAGYRTPVRSRVEDVANPFGQNYLQSLEGRAISDAARQMTAQRQQIRSMLGSRGLMAGGGTGLEAQLMAQAMGEGYRARAEALDRARTQTALEAANFEQRRAQLIDAYNRGLMSDAQALALLPGQIRLGESQADIGESQARIERGSEQAKIDMARYQADEQRSRATIAEADAALKRYTPEQQQELIELFMREARSRTGQSEAELEAAKKVLERGSVQDLPLWGKALIVGGGALAGFFLGGPPGALLGAQLGSVGVGALSGQDAYAVGQMAQPYLPRQNQAGGSTQAPLGGSILKPIIPTRPPGYPMPTSFPQPPLVG